MKRGAENPVPHLLIVDHNPWLGEKRHEAIRNTQLCCGLTTILSTSGTPKVKLGSIGFESPDMLNNRDNRDPSGAHCANESVIDINVDNHGVALSKLGERLGSGDGGRKTLLTRQMRFEPLPASVLFVPDRRFRVLVSGVI